MLTLQQKVNIYKGTALTDAVTFVEKAKQSIQKIAQDILNSTITPEHVCFTDHSVSQSALNEWAFRALRSSMDVYMLPMILDDADLPADPSTATDAQINTAVRQALWPYVQQIGLGSF